MTKRRRHLSLIMLLSVAAFLSACSYYTRVKTISPPAASVKLRVYLQGTAPQQELVTEQMRLLEKQLQQTGIFEVVQGEEVEAALGKKKPARPQLQRGDWELARKIGRALFADYVVVAGSTPAGDAQSTWEEVLVNVANGKSFTKTVPLASAAGSEEKSRLLKEAVKASYAQLFRDAKEDLLATALKKRDQVEIAAVGKAAERRAREVEEAREAWQQRKAREKKEAAEAKETSAILTALTPRRPPPSQGKERLVVFDFAAAESYGPIALILAEELREDFDALGRYIVVDREELDRVLKEEKVRQPGLVGEAVRLGNALAARQVITGSLSTRGTKVTLQAKRTEVETLKTVAVQSMSFSEGNEELFLEQMPQFVRALAKERREPIRR